MGSMPHRSSIFAAVASCLFAFLPAASVTASDATPAASAPLAHVLFDDTTAPAASGIPGGGTAAPLIHPKISYATSTSGSMGRTSQSAIRPATEVLGFAQSGEVTSGAWQSDLQLSLLTTVAYFGLNFNTDGTFVTSDAGYQGYWSQQEAAMTSGAHNAGDRVVVTVKAFNNTTISGVTGSETARQTAIANVISQIRSRGADGVNVDFEGSGSSLAANFNTFISELRGGLQNQVPGQSFLTVDTYASAASGGTMYDIRGLSPNVDAFDVMAYDITSPASSTAGPVAPLSGMTYADDTTVSDYLSLVPASKVILGVPYYGYKWSTTATNSCCPPGARASTQGSASADTYSDVFADFSCALSLNQFYDTTFQTPWAYWWSPSGGDPCGGNHGAWRELYWDNVQSLGMKYDLVNNRSLRGIGIWALGYDSGHSELWNLIRQKFATQTPSETVTAFSSSSQSNTAFQVCWTPTPTSEPIAHTVVWVDTDTSGHYIPWVDTAASCDTFYGIQGRTYSFFAQGFGSVDGSPGPSRAQATTQVSSTATRANPFTSLYGVDAYGNLHPASSPPLPVSATWNWNIARGLTLDGDGQGGQVLDGWGGLHPFGNASPLNTSAYWHGWDIARGIAQSSAVGGYVLDGFGGLHPYGSSPPIPGGFQYNTGDASSRAAPGAYWQGWDIARAVVLRSDGTSGYVLDGFGGLHPFGGAPAIPGGYQYDATDPNARSAPGAYWHGWDIARGVVLRADGVSGYVLDGFGGTHPFGGAPPLNGGTQYNSNDTQARSAQGAYWQGWDIARGIVLESDGVSGYVMDGYGGFHPFGAAPQVNLPNYLQQDLVKGPALAG